MTNTTKTLIKQYADTIDAIIEKRIRWEEGTYAAANAELYAILANCLDLFLALKSNMGAGKAVNALLDQRGITYNSATSLELKLVRLVFASADTAARIHNRLFTYARVIRVAADAKQTGETIAKFITDRHGIDEIRRAANNGVSLADKQKGLAERARVHLIEPGEDDLFTDFDLPDQLQPADGEQFSLALVRKNADGTGSIVFGTNNGTAVSTVLSIAGKALQEKAFEAAEAAAASKAEAHKQRNIAEVNAQIAKTGNANAPLSSADARIAEPAHA